jgi:Peptidase family M48
MRIVKSGLFPLILIVLSVAAMQVAAQDAPAADSQQPSATQPSAPQTSAPATLTPQSPDPQSAAPQTSAQTPAPQTQAPQSVPSAPPPPPAAANLNQVIDRVTEREHLFIAQMRHLHPMVETYLQDLRTDKDGNLSPSKDQYFLGRLAMTDGPEDTSFVGQPGFSKRMLGHLTGLYAMHFLPLGFAQMVVVDDDFQKKYYEFSFVRREFLGEVRCLVIDVQPKKDAPPGRFLGRIWVEDQDYNIVRFNGTYYPQPKLGFYLHFDSWRLNMRQGTWLPAYIYSEEANLKTGLTKNVHFKAQTRLWGYDLKGLGSNEEFTQILVDSPQSIKDESTAAADASPVMAERMWEKQAEDNVVDRIQRIGLLAPPGEVDKVLATVVNNLLVTNNIDIGGDFRCRVLLTAPLESFTIGHTIVLSRGLLDVLPDEASLAMVLSHQLAHIVLGHRFDTKMAFNDRMFFPDEEAFQKVSFRHTEKDEDAADAKAMEMLKNSPYKDKLGNGGLFLKVLQEKAPDLPNLLRPHMGDGLAEGKNIRMAGLITSAPELDAKRLDQIAALPLGGRIKLDPWSDQVELAKAKAVALTSSREKMPFEITPFFPFLTRYATAGTDKVAFTTPAGSANEPK